MARKKTRSTSPVTPPSHRTQTQKRTSGDDPGNEKELFSFETLSDVPPFHLDEREDLEIPIVEHIGKQKKRAIGYFGTIMVWSTRSGGNVTLSNKIEVWNGREEKKVRIPCTLVIRKQELIEFVRESQQREGTDDLHAPGGMFSLSVWGALAQWRIVLANNPPAQALSLRFDPPYHRVRLKMRHEDLQVLKEFFADPNIPRSAKWGDDCAQRVSLAFPALWTRFIELQSSPPWRHISDLALNFDVLLLDPNVTRLVLNPPRGHAAAASLTVRQIEAALFSAQYLVQLQERDAEVKERVNRTLERMRVDPHLSAYQHRFARSKTVIPVLLTQRRFMKKNPPLSLIGPPQQWIPPRTIVQRYLFKKGQLRPYASRVDYAFTRDPSLRQRVTQGWVDEYLVP